jgi:hypothetical protein
LPGAGRVRGGSGELFNEYEVCKMKNVLWMDGGDGCSTKICLVPVKSTLENGLNGKFHVMYILLQFKNKYF